MKYGIKKTKRYRIKSKRLPSIKTVDFRLKQKRGQMVIVGIMVLVMSIMIFVATLPAIKGVMDTSRGCSYLNCVGYVDRDAVANTTSCAANNQTYLSGIQQDKFACTIMDLGIPYLILGVLVGLVGKLISGRLMAEEQPQQQYGGY